MSKREIEYHNEAARRCLAPLTYRSWFPPRRWIEACTECDGCRAYMLQRLEER